MDNVDESLFDRLFTAPISLPCPAISIVIPMYNAEEFIAECLESILGQTFQSFEVIVVDDCSTDLSREVVERYIPAFDGRLRLEKTEVNSGGGGYIPRNIGLSLASGEYVIFIDADDFILLSALEMLYNAAKEYNSDVVYTATHYQLRKPNDLYVLKDGKGKKLQEGGLKDKTTLIVNDSDKNLQTIIFEKGFTTPWTQFVRRNFLLENKIVFPEIPKAGDFIWVINIYCHAKRFLRFTTPLYFYRIYNVNSVSQRKARIDELSNWFSAFVIFIKNLVALSEDIEILRKKPNYSYEVSKRYLEWCLNRTNDAQNELSNQEMYELLYREFSSRNNFNDFTIPFFFSKIASDRRDLKDNQKTIDKLKKELDQSYKALTCPAISIIIPFYNSEKYIAKCLDSILAQTFQNFEINIVDNCSTDSSCKIVERYIPKFNGRLKLSHMRKHTCSGALPRNKGLTLSTGKYVFNMDSDDMLTKTALDELYKLAEKYNADVVYCEKFYEANPDGSNAKVRVMQKGGVVNKPTFESEKLTDRIQAILNNRYYVVPWNKLIRRNLLIEHEIVFPDLKISDDNIWHQELLFYAKKFLRVPNTIYIYRLSENSLLRSEKTPKQRINFWLDPVLLGLKNFDERIRKHEFFKENPSYHYDLLKNFIDTRFSWTLNSARELTKDNIYSILKNDFGEKLGKYDVLIPALCTALYDAKETHRKEKEAHEKDKKAIAEERKAHAEEKKAIAEERKTHAEEKKAIAEERKTHAEEKKAYNNLAQIIRRFAPYLTARIDLKLIAEANESDFQIISLTDSNAKVIKPGWYNKDGIGYVINSYAGKLKVVAKVAVDGKFQLYLRGRDVRDPKNRAKHVPQWIDYNKLTVNLQTILDTPTPVWHDKPYRHIIDVKADDEITVEVEWLPHRSDT